ncbi:hypothetical protein Tco_1579035, partial [Tanacetum coccineum]
AHKSTLRFDQPVQVMVVTTLAYFFVKRIECAKATSTANLPYGMFLTLLYRYVMETYPHLDNGTNDIVERVMRPLALR